MNKKVLVIGASFLTVAITMIIPAAATAGPKEEAEQAQVRLIGITTSQGRTQALLRVKWPARVANREASYMLSEGQSIDGLTLDSLGVTNATVTLKEGQLSRTVRLQMAAGFIPSGLIDLTNAEVPQVLQIYSALAGVKLVTDSRVTKTGRTVTIMTGASGKEEAAKIVEKALLEQTGTVITRLDQERASVTYNDALPITPAKKAPANSKSGK